MTASAESIKALEFERKYLLPPGEMSAAAACLDAFCRPDPVYRAGIISSIYYDTPSLRLLGEKQDSTLYKTKVRLRWYEDPHQGPVGKSFLEVKSRVGQRRAKWRQPVELEAADLSTISLADPRLLTPLRLLAEDPTVSILGLTPILVVRYNRRRWNDPLTGARISLDYGISAPAVNPRRLPAARPEKLPQVILEVKNSSGMIPPRLPFLSALGAASCSFSKYFECHQVLTGAAIRVA